MVLLRPDLFRYDTTQVRWCRLRLLLIVTLLGAAGWPARADWIQTYIWKAQVGASSVVIAPSNANRVYALTGDQPWLLRSDDRGATWHRSPDIAAHSGIYCIAVDPTDADTLYVSVSSNVAPGLFKSLDGGLSFTRLSGAIFDPAPNRILVDPKDPRVLYAARPPVCAATCSPGGVVKSIDAGATWSDTARTDNISFSLAIDPNDSLILYNTGYDVPLTRQTGGLYRTTDGGLTWPMMFEGLSRLDYIAVDRESRVYAIGSVQFEKPLLRSTSHGDRWERILFNVPPPDPGRVGEGAWPNLTAVAFDPRRNETLYVSATTHGILTSVDDGVTWQTLGNLPDHAVDAFAVTEEGVIIAATRTGLFQYVPPPPRRRASAKP
jgi:photosystem II stability/assembly factor-like uncharacterized protein